MRVHCSLAGRARSREDLSPLKGLANMKRRLLITTFAFGLLFLAHAGWLVQAVRLMPRLLVASAS
jgi:hypothetical protein